MKNPFSNKNIENEQKEEKPTTLKDVDVFAISETELTERVKTVTSPEIRERYRTLNKTNRNLKPEGMETPTELSQRREKIVRAIQILGREIDLREQQEREVAHARGVEWVKQTIPAQLPNLRVCRDASLLRVGIVNIPACRWETLTSTTLTMKTEQGFEQVFNLLEMPASFLKHMLSAPFNPFFVPYGGTSRYGKPVTQAWQPNDFKTEMATKVSPLRYFSIMKV